MSLKQQDNQKQIKKSSEFQVQFKAMFLSAEDKLHTLVSCSSAAVASSHPAELPSVSFLSFQDDSVVLTPVQAPLQHPGEGFTVQGQSSCCATWKEQDHAEIAITASKEATTKFSVSFCYDQFDFRFSIFRSLLCAFLKYFLFALFKKSQLFSHFVGVSYTALPLHKY